jgi:hypothetical protein
VLDQLRARCLELGITLVDLDAYTGRKKYFRSSSRGCSLSGVAAGVAALGGRLRGRAKIEWLTED